MVEDEDEDDPGFTHCPCCDFPYPQPEHFYHLCIDNIDLGELGPGLPLMFEFIKYCGFMLAVLTLFYFVPAISMIGLSFEDITVAGKQNNLSLFSFGALVTQAKTEDEILEEKLAKYQEEK